IGDTPGRVVVVAAGNSGEADAHASSTLLDGVHEIPIHIAAADPTMPSGASGHSTVGLEIFYDTAAPHTDGAAAVDIEIKGPGGKALKGPGGQALQGDFDDDGLATVDNSDMAMTGLRGVAVVIAKTAKQASIKAGDWTLRLRGQTLRYDAWIVEPVEDD